MNVSETLATWYQTSKRNLPWRESSDPYNIWLSEIILQQTRVDQGLAYYLRFIEKFPSVNHLARTSIEEVLKMWEGLGYYSRARNLHVAAKEVVSEFQGHFPANYDALRKLKGVGDYTAAAIASMAFNLPYAAVDGNVYRVLARYFGIDISPYTAKGKKYFQELAQEILDVRHPGRHNQSMMELGALICTPKLPKCSLCPLSTSCVGLERKLIDELPVRKTKTIIRHRYLYYIVIRRGDQIFIQQRPLGDIWALLFEFPLIETDKPISIETIVQHKKWNELFTPCAHEIVGISTVYKHQLSHQLLYTQFIRVNAPLSFESRKHLEIDANELSKYPFPRLILKYMEAELHGAGR